MRILFVHPGFPGQFMHLAPALAARGDTVAAISLRPVPPLPGVQAICATPTYRSGAQHPWAKATETMAIHAEASLRAALAVKAQGFDPDVIVAHPGWGDALFLKDVWPNARLGLYCEHFLAPLGAPPFDPEFTVTDHPIAIRAYDKVRSIQQQLLFDLAEAGLSPTYFQRSTYPRDFAKRIAVAHDGIDVDRIRRRTGASFSLAGGKVVTAADEVVTYIARHLEPARGFNVFLRALPDLLKARPQAEVVIVGADAGGYGEAPPAGQGSWREIFLREVGARLDLTRVHFTGPLAYPAYLDLLSVARLRIYLTHPTVLSWSVLEAMAAGLPVLGSDTAPVAEVITDGETGRLFPYHDGASMVRIAIELLDDEGQRLSLATNARRLIEERYALKSVCLPQQFAWIDWLATAKPRPSLMERR